MRSTARYLVAVLEIVGGGSPDFFFSSEAPDIEKEKRKLDSMRKS